MVNIILFMAHPMLPIIDWFRERNYNRWFELLWDVIFTNAKHKFHFTYSLFQIMFRQLTYVNVYPLKNGLARVAKGHQISSTDSHLSYRSFAAFKQEDQEFEWVEDCHYNKRPICRQQHKEPREDWPFTHWNGIRLKSTRSDDDAAHCWA